MTTNRILYYDSARQGWNTLGTGVNDDVYATAILPGGDIVAGGFFTTAGGISTSCIARYKYNTRVWSAMGAGTDDFVSCLAVLPDGDLVAGGNFSFANNTLVNHIARYRPSTGAWSALGAGTNDYVASLAITPDGDLIVGGLFSSMLNNRFGELARKPDARLVAWLNAAVARTYQLTSDEFAHVLASFPLIDASERDAMRRAFERPEEAAL